MPESKKVNDNDKLMGVLAYLSILVLVPIFAGGKSKFVKFHANQGLVLLLSHVALSVVYMIFISIAFATSGLSLILLPLFGLVGLGLLVLAILGIINVVNGEQKPLPIIGGITLLK